MFCFSFTGFIILPQLGKSSLWPFWAERQFIVGWFKAKKGKLQKASQFRERDGDRSSQRKNAALSQFHNESIQITAESQRTGCGRGIYPLSVLRGRGEREKCSIIERADWASLIRWSVNSLCHFIGNYLFRTTNTSKGMEGWKGMKAANKQLLKNSEKWQSQSLQMSCLVQPAIENPKWFSSWKWKAVR